ncbi:hypothetical protein PMAYCL1PPCAC_04250, partial [Pristionchus mayeri]
MVRLRPMTIAFFAVFAIAVIVAIVLAVVLSKPSSSDASKTQYLTVSLYVGDLDYPLNARRKRDADTSKCMTLDETKNTVIQSLLQLGSSVSQVRILTYTTSTTASEYMSPSTAVNYLNGIKAVSGYPAQASSIEKFKKERKSSAEDLMHFMPCNTDYPNAQQDKKDTGDMLNELIEDKERKVTLVSRSQTEEEIKEDYGLEQEATDLKIIDVKTESDDIVNEIVSSIETTISTALTTPTTPSTTTTTPSTTTITTTTTTKPPPPTTITTTTKKPTTTTSPVEPDLTTSSEEPKTTASESTEPSDEPPNTSSTATPSTSPSTSPTTPSTTTTTAPPPTTSTTTIEPPRTTPPVEPDI